MYHNPSDENSSLFISFSIGDSTSPIMQTSQQAIDQPMDDLNKTMNEEAETTATVKTGAAIDCTIEENNEKEEDVLQKRKRQKTSVVWADFTEARDKDGVMTVSCNHCKKEFAKTKTTPTTQLHRHLKICATYLRIKAAKEKEQFTQAQLGFMPMNVDAASFPALHDGKFDMEKMKESIAHWILMHEHRFIIVEEEGFNMMQKRGMTEWRGLTRNTAKNYCVQIYEMEKRKLKTLLKSVSKISITTDLWKSKNQKIEYMVITGHWIDHTWKLQKRILNFVHLPPPRRGIDIANAIWENLVDWGIESKVHTISVDNASANNQAIENMRTFVKSKKKLLCEGKLFHVRCCAHILNLVAQDGLSQIGDIINIVRDSVEYVRRSEARLKIFSQIVKQLNLQDRKLVDDCRTRWNSTYEMLATAITFKDVFPRFAQLDTHYEGCPSEKDWEKVEKVSSMLEVFWTSTHIISGSDYPTSNLFLNEVYRVKVLLDKKSKEKDDFIKEMVKEMKIKFDKYWGETNLLMSIAAVLDPRCKMRALEFCFPKLYSPEMATEEIAFVKDCLKELYSDYVEMYNDDCSSIEKASKIVLSSQNTKHAEFSACGWSEYNDYLDKVESIEPQKSELGTYLEEGCYRLDKDKMNAGLEFDVLEWWKIHSLKYKILSTLARDILAIPMSTVASESAFSAGSRVIDKYRASLAPETVQVLMCGGDWLRKRFGVKKKYQGNKNAIHVILPVDDETSKI